MENFRKKEVFKKWEERTLAAYVLFGFKSASDGSWTLKCTPAAEAKSYILSDAMTLWNELPKLQVDLTLIRYCISGPEVCSHPG